MVRWKHSGKTLMDVIDYAIYLARQRAQSDLTVETAVYNIVVFMSFCSRLGVEPVNIDDVQLRKFRDFELVRLREGVGRKGSDKVQARTVNSRLKTVYHFLLWFQSSRIGCKGLIGPSACRIRSSLTEKYIEGYRKGNLKLLYPLLFPLTGSSSKHRPVKAATESIKRSVIRYFSSIGDDYIASRNILIIDIADSMGMRRASINSLTCAQFMTALAEEEALADLVIVPSSQKFGYQWSYTFPFQLVSEVLQYIEGPRKALLEKLNVSSAASEDKLFLSSKTGKPLTNRAITNLIASPMRSAGMAKGSIHSFRHKFVNEEVEREILRRIKLGLDTSIESIAAAVALKVGHANPGSLHSYISDIFSRIENKLPVDNKNKIQYLEQEIERLTQQLNSLRSLNPAY